MFTKESNRVFKMLFMNRTRSACVVFYLNKDGQEYTFGQMIDRWMDFVPAECWDQCVVEFRDGFIKISSTVAEYLLPFVVETTFDSRIEYSVLIGRK